MSAATARTLRATGACLVLTCVFSVATPALAVTSAPAAVSAGFHNGSNLNWDVAPGHSENLNWD